MKKYRTLSKNLHSGVSTLKKQFYLAVILCLMLPGSLLKGQETDSLQYVKGVVIDAVTKAPIFAAQIKTLINEAAATSDENGEFTIQVISDNELLIVNAFTYNTREVAVRGQKELQIMLYPNNFSDDYQTVVRITGNDFTPNQINGISSISQLGNPDVLATDEKIQEIMSGNVRSIKNSGNMGFGTNLFVRGFNSLNLNSQPLFIVDGVIWNAFEHSTTLHSGFYNNPLADIAISDIENITLLKDGTSLYGSKGSNGVILITTTRGKDMATKITFSAMGGIIEQPVSLPLMNGEQFRLYATDMYASAGYPAQYFETLDFIQEDPDNLAYLKYHNNTNWDDEVYQRGNIQSYNISVNGGDQRALYAFSIDYTDGDGVVKGNDLQRLSTRFNADFFLNDRVKTGLNVGFTNSTRNMLNDGVEFLTSPTYLAMAKASFLSPYAYTVEGTLTDVVVDSDVFGIGNPTAILENSLNTNKNYKLNLGLKPEIKISNSVTLTNLFDFSFAKLKETYYRPIIGAVDVYYPGLGYSENTFRNLQTRNSHFFNDARLQFKKQYGASHRLNAIAGSRFLADYFEADYAEGHNTGSEQKRNLLKEEEFKRSDGLTTRTKSISNYANIDYSYDHRYYVTLAAALDASSRFGSETQGGIQLFGQSWGFFPSLQAAWLMSSETFMASASFIDYLNIRAGYGITGNDGIEDYASKAYFVSAKYISYANGLVIGNIANPELQWETTGKMNVGIDAWLFNNRLSITADLYNNRTTDLLTLAEVPDIAGNGFYWKNGGELSNKGYELSTKIKVLNISALKWEVEASVGHYTNEIESLPEGDFTTSIFDAEIMSAVGNPAGVFYGYKTDGVFTTYAEASEANLKMIDDNGIEHYFSAGDVHFLEKEGFVDGIIDENDKQIIGDPNPDYYGSLSNTFSFGNFNVNGIVNFSYGNDVYNYLRASLESGKDLKNQTTAMLNRWTYEEQVTEQPKAVYGDPMENSRFSDRWIEDGSYIRLKSVSINYNIPINNEFIEGISLWASAKNLITLTNYLGRDPEVSAGSSLLFQGIDAGYIPACKSYHVGIKLNL